MFLLESEPDALSIEPLLTWVAKLMRYMINNSRN